MWWEEVIKELTKKSREANYDTLWCASSSASIFDHGIEMMQLDPFRQFGPFFFTQTDHIELLHNHPSQLWPAAYWQATYHACV